MVVALTRAILLLAHETVIIFFTATKIGRKTLPMATAPTFTSALFARWSCELWSADAFPIDAVSPVAAHFPVIKWTKELIALVADPCWVAEAFIFHNGQIIFCGTPHIWKGVPMFAAVKVIAAAGHITPFTFHPF
jgi:hypothetical protein